MRLGLTLLSVVAATTGAAALTRADTHDNCGTWAQGGECDVNPTFMKAECATACAKAPPSILSQVRKECEGYAKQGECSRNPAFMLGTCRKECDAWEVKTGLAIDRDGQCVQWSLLGECERDPAAMAKKCNTSCTVRQRCARSNFSGWSAGVCDKALRCEAADTMFRCAALAAAGECRKDPAKMAQGCLQTCAEHDVGEAY